MKMSVIFGVLHMCLGIVMKGANTIHFRQRAVLWCEVVAGLIMLLGLFGWMYVLVLAKWLYPNDIDNYQTRADWAFNFFWTEPLKNGRESPIKTFSLEEYDKLSKQGIGYFNCTLPATVGCSQAPGPWCAYQRDYNSGRMTSVIAILISTFISQGGPLEPLPAHLLNQKGAK